MLLPSPEAIRYLEFAVDQLNCREQAIHHQLILLLTRTKEEGEGEVRLLDYFKRFNSPDLVQVLSGVRFGRLALDDNEAVSTISAAFSTMEPSRFFNILHHIKDTLSIHILVKCGLS